MKNTVAPKQSNEKAALIGISALRTALYLEKKASFKPQRKRGLN